VTAVAPIAEGLARFEARGPCTDAERRAAGWLHDELRAAGHEAWVETHWVRPHWALALALGALLAAGSVADHYADDWWAGAIAGLACAALGFQAARSLFGRVRRRLDEQAANALPVWAEGAALLAAGVSILFPPLAILVIAGLVWLLAGGRRRADEKYAGLRILR